MIDEQVKDVTPEPQQADAGDTDTTEQTGTPTETPTPEQKAFDAQAAINELTEKLTNMGREVGQGRALQSRLDKLAAILEKSSQPQPKNPSQDEILGKYSPDQIAESEALIELLWKKKFGSDWERTQAEIRENKAERIGNVFENSARTYAGKDYNTLDPLMTKIASAAHEAANNGDPEASEFVQVMTQFPKVGARQLVALAREWHAETVKGQSAQAGAAQVQRGASAAAKSPGGVSKPIGAADPSKMSIDDLRKAVEAELGN